MFASRNFLFAKAIAAAAGNPLFSWGRNNFGQLGLGDATNRSSPVQVSTGWETPSSGAGSSLCTKTDGTLWAWGRNQYGQLGQNNTTVRSSPVQVGALTNWLTPSGGAGFSTCIKTDGTLWSWGRNNNYGQLGLGNTTNYSSPKQIGASTNWNKVSAGYKCVLATESNGKLFAWGGNSNGQLGLNDATDRSSPVQVGVVEAVVE